MLYFKKILFLELGLQYNNLHLKKYLAKYMKYTP